MAQPTWDSEDRQMYPELDVLTLKPPDRAFMRNIEFKGRLSFLEQKRLAKIWRAEGLEK